jgi:hypothetical protein
MTPCTRSALPSALPLIHIRRGYAASCHNLRLAVETASDGWAAEVRDPRDGRTLYNARRCSLDAAKTAIAEFAIFAAAGAGGQSPEELARQLRWQEYW